MPLTSEAVVRQALNTAAPSISLVGSGSPYCYLHRDDGSIVTKTITITGTGGEVVTNLFSFTSTIELVDLYGILTSVTDITKLDGIWWDVWDGANSVALTADGGNMTGFALGSVIAKDQLATQVARVLNSSQVRYQEQANNNPRIFIGGLIVPKNGVTNYVRLRADTNLVTNVSIQCVMAWVCRQPGGTGVIAV